MRYRRKLSKKLQRRFKTLWRLYARALKKPRAIIVALLALGLTSVILIPMHKTQVIDASNLLDVIAKVESKSNYNAYYGNATNTATRFTSMSVEQVLAWQKQFIEQGSPSSAVGRYQFMDTTLRGLVSNLHIDPSTKFDQPLQDKLATALLERRGIRDYINGTISRDAFAHNLSKEWASLPRVIGDHPEQSYYAHDGLNTALLSLPELYTALATVHTVSTH